MGMMERCMAAMGGGAMGVMLLVASFLLLFVWIVGLAAVGALGFWGFKRLSGRTGSR